MTNLEIEKKEELITRQLNHLKISTKAREYMNRCVEESKQCVGDFILGVHQPQTGPTMAHYGFDFAQQVSL